MIINFITQKCNIHHKNIRKIMDLVAIHENQVNMCKILKFYFKIKCINILIHYKIDGKGKIINCTN